MYYKGKANFSLQFFSLCSLKKTAEEGFCFGTERSTLKFSTITQNEFEGGRPIFLLPFFKLLK